jgi:hypothetical protein
MYLISYTCFVPLSVTSPYIWALYFKTLQTCNKRYVNRFRGKPASLCQTKIEESSEKLDITIVKKCYNYDDFKK